MSPRIPKHLISQASKGLDRQPLPLTVAAGVILGLGLGLPGFWYLRHPGWLLLWGVLFVALWRMGHHAALVFEDEHRIPAKPQRVRDGPMVMMELPGGQFLMGSPDSDGMARVGEKPQRTVTVSGFRIAVTPVTEELYREVMEQVPPPAEQRRLPIVGVRWDEAIQFCNALSEREGYQPCYRQVRHRWVCDWHADGYRLPTEAEWEYACRAGTETRYSFGDDPGELDRYAWFDGNSEYQRQEVAQKAPNPWGLYDMHGNVWEWCWDSYKLYSLTRVRDWDDLRQFVKPQWRVARGGSFFHQSEFLRSAYRFKFSPVNQLTARGFRCVRVPSGLS
ncbi:MAG: hypothetical protein ETSY2_33910 [Candidatus Entotheonella gemina]|uniref:Sulfatase-modifying factor enzyme-like domain-containing protein n=1 Tax=Candidatus Entotheonella gemina TaxID=1429439 RepID=W4M0R2_9BACT|nr:MAG: hypothetical protein ETSY2_33910 [Candidatus Entotheonella gemina]